MSNALPQEFSVPAMSDESAGAQHPEPAQILELTTRTGTTVTPREINDQLARILQSYDELTATYAQQSAVIATLAGSTSADIQAVQQALQAGLLDAEERNSIQLTTITQRVGQDVSRLDGGLHALGQLLDGQQKNIQLQSERLSQFDVLHELLDTATRGNRTRIEAVREALETQQTVVSAQVKGLEALQREHHTEFLSLRAEVGAITAQIRQLEFGQQHTNTRLATHVLATQTRFRWASGALALAMLLTMGSVAAIKWLPAFAPVTTEAALAQTTQELAQVRQHVSEELAQLPAMEYRALTQEGQISQLSRTVAALRQSLAELSGRVSRANLLPASGLSVDEITVFDGQWVREQPPSHYTVQLAGVGTQEQMTGLIKTNPEHLAQKPLAYTVTQPQEQTRFNVFMGSYATSGEARAAIDRLPASLRASKPWVRQWQAVQAAAQ